MDIYVHSRGIELEKKERNRILPFHESSVVALTNSPGHETAFYCAAVYEHELLTARLSAQTCLPDKTADSNFGRSSVTDLDEAL